MPARDVLAAGVVAFRGTREVLLVHRPRYDDWSFPKGKLDPGEHPAAAAVREAREETGLRVRLGPSLQPQRYRVAGPAGRPHDQRLKTVRYWTARPVADDEVSGYGANDEIDAVAWVDRDQARRLSYARDHDTLREAARTPKPTTPLIVLRHAEARARTAWRRDDRQRPLLKRGTMRAERLAPVLAAYGATRLVSSSSTRCVQTLAPYADAVDGKVEASDLLSEQDATHQAVRALVSDVARTLSASDQAIALCTHRAVLPMVFDALGLPDPRLEKGEMLVAHVRRSRVVATERHAVH